MPNVIDALVVTLGLDPKEYKRGTKEAEKAQKDFSRKTERDTRKQTRLEKKIHDQRKKDNKEFIQQGKEAIQVYRKIRNEALSVLAVFGAGVGMVAFAKNTLTAAANLHFAARNMGVSVQKMAGYQELMKTVGGNASDAESLLKIASSPQAQRALGEPISLLPKLERTGTFHMQPGDLFNTEKMVTDIANAIHEEVQKHGVVKGRAYAESLGLNQAQFNALMKGGAWVQSQASYFGRRSGMTAAKSDRAQRERVQFEKIAQSFKGTMTNIVLDMQPIIDKLEGWATKMANWSVGHQKDIQKFMENFVNNMMKLGPVLKESAKDVMTLVNALSTMVKWFNKMGIHLSKKDTQLGPQTATDKKIKALPGHAVSALKKDLEGLNKFLWGIVPGSPENQDFISSLRSLWNGGGIGSALENIQNINRLASGANGYMNNSNNTTTANAHIQNVHINTQATDGNGIMQDLLGGGGLFSFVPQSDGALR